MDTTNNDLKFAKSTNNGTNWAVQTIDSTGLVGNYCSIAASGSDVYISYYDATNADLKFARSTDAGETWPIANIKTIDPDGSVGSDTAAAVSGSNFYIAYYDTTAGTLNFAKSIDSGATFTAGNMRTIDTVGGQGANTAMFANGASICIAYYKASDSSINFVKSTDNGDTWPAANIKTVDSDGNVGYEKNSICGYSTNVYISYYDSTNSNLKFAKSTDYGDTWLPGNIETIDSDSGSCSSIAVSVSNVYISYYNNLNQDLKFTKSSNAGSTWPAGNIRKFDTDIVSGIYNSIAISGSYIFIAYRDSTNEYLKFLRLSD
jgi:hypothetical protein